MSRPHTSRAAARAGARKLLDVGEGTDKAHSRGSPHCPATWNRLSFPASASQRILELQGVLQSPAQSSPPGRGCSATPRRSPPPRGFGSSAASLRVRFPDPRALIGNPLASVPKRMDRPLKSHCFSELRDPLRIRYPGIPGKTPRQRYLPVAPRARASPASA